MSNPRRPRPQGTVASSLLWSIDLTGLLSLTGMRSLSHELISADLRLERTGPCDTLDAHCQGLTLPSKWIVYTNTTGTINPSGFALQASGPK